MKIKKNKNFWVYILGGIILLILGIMLCPQWMKVEGNLFFKNWGIGVVSYVMAALIILYVVYLITKKFKPASGIIKTLVIIEIILMILIALSLILTGINVLNLPDEPLVIIGVACYIRGFIEIIKAYYVMKAYTKDNQIKPYPLWKLVASIILLSFGVMFMFKVIFRNLDKVFLAWLIALSVFITGLVLIVVGTMSKPDKAKK